MVTMTYDVSVLVNMYCLYMYFMRLTNPQKGLLVGITKTNGDRGRKFDPETNYHTLPGFEPDVVQRLHGSMCKMGMTSYPFWIRFWS